MGGLRIDYNQTAWTAWLLAKEWLSEAQHYFKGNGIKSFSKQLGIKC